MKRLLSVLLTACMLGSALFSMPGCTTKKEISLGTEAAKLLLANERLDEDLVGSKVDVGLTSEAETSVSPVKNMVKRPAFAADPSRLSATSETSHKWTEFPAASTSLEEFSLAIENIEGQVYRVSEDIAHMKNNVGITDKWVKTGDEWQMLRVYDNYDMLLVIDELNYVHVYYRYTDENAKNIYEMFSFITDDNGVTNEVRTLFIPNERYEYMYNAANGFTDYYIAENTRGYWMSTRFNYNINSEENEEHTQFTPYIVKDGLGSGAFLTMNSKENGGEAENCWYTVFDPNGRELFRIVEDLERYYIGLNFAAIRDGFISVSAENFWAFEGGKAYETGMVNALETRNGVYTTTPDPVQLIPGQFEFINATVEARYNRGEELINYGFLEFVTSAEGTSLNETCLNLSSYLDSLGLELYCDMEAVAISLNHAALLVDGFADSFEWNGYKMSSIENVRKAREVLQGQFDDARAEYEKVKDYETVTSSQTLPSDAHFATLETAVAGENTFDGTNVILSGVSVSTSDVALFEDGNEYVLKVGLSRLDDNGAPSSVNTVTLTGTELASVQFGGQSIALEASGSYEIPKDLDSGQYAAVVYIATKEEGLRVSQMQKIAFVSIEDGEIESSLMYVEAVGQDDNLIVKYEIKNMRKITLEATKEVYSYDEIERYIILEVLAYGAPYCGATLEYENGETVEEGAVLGVGTYRMICYLATADGLAQSYIYLTVE